MGNGRRRGIHFALVTALVVVAATMVASTGSAMSFVDEICPPQQGTIPELKVCPSGTIGTPYSLQLKGYKGCWPDDGSSPGDMVTFAVTGGALPQGLSLSSSGLISGTPTSAGVARFFVSMANHAGVSWCEDNLVTGRDFVMQVNPGLRIVTNDLPQNATVGQAYAAQLDAQVVTNLNPFTGTAATGATWTVVSGVGTGLPPGLALGVGVISGSPMTEGSYSFRIQASLNGASHFQTYSLTVRQPLKVAASKPLATPPSPTAWEVGLPFSAKLTASGGSGTYTYALAGGALPTGLALAADGTVSGTPKAAGIFRSTIRVADSEGRTLDYAANFGVAQKLTISTILLRPGKVGRLYRAKLATSGGIAPKTWRIVSGPLPKGIKLDRKLGVLTGVPKKPGSYRVRFEAKDGLGVAAQKTLRIVVAP